MEEGATEVDVLPARRAAGDEPTYDRETVLALAQFNPLGPVMTRSVRGF